MYRKRNKQFDHHHHHHQRKGVIEGQAPQKGREISSQLPVRKEATWRRKGKEGRVRRDEEEPTCTE
jgi:hypothetical protein